MKALLLVAILTACGDGSATRSVDATGASDASAIDAPPTHGTALSHTLFVATEGLTVTPGADDATMDKSSIPTTAAPLVAFAASAGDRATAIAAIVTELEAIYAPYDLSIVTTRPATGPYDTVVLTDSASTALGLTAGGVAIVPGSCNATPSVMMFVFKDAAGTMPTSQGTRDFIVALTVAMLGDTAGIPFSKKNGDCMCFSDTACKLPTAACTIGGAGTPVDTANSFCGTPPATMDEQAQFLATFGAH